MEFDLSDGQLDSGRTLFSGLRLDAGRVGRSENTEERKQRGILHLRMPYAKLEESSPCSICPEGRMPQGRWA